MGPESQTINQDNVKKIWTPRERIRAAIELKQADRVPLAFGGSYYHLADELYFNILEFLGLPFEPERLFRRNKGHVGNYNDDRVLEALGVDVRYAWLGSTDVNSPDFSDVPDDIEDIEDIEGTDLYGVGYRKTIFL